jgi:MoaA/NifB/PqqE/SkfB family radical SAM enzyme
MSAVEGLRCRHAFEYACVHANGDVVCSMIDGRGDFVLGNVTERSLVDILTGRRAEELRRLVLSTEGSYCPGVGRNCPLKSIPTASRDRTPVALRFLGVEPTTACRLRCLTCLVRDFAGDVSWKDAYGHGGASFLLWDGARRMKQEAADELKRRIPRQRGPALLPASRVGALFSRGRPSPGRTGTLTIEVLKRVVTEAGPAVERLDLFGYGETFLYPYLTEALRHVRVTLPSATIAISTGGMDIPRRVEDAIVSERLVDWLVVSLDGCDQESYGRYRVGGDFDLVFSNLTRLYERTSGTGIRVVWQYVVFRWNDRDEQLNRAIAMAEERGIELQFDFSRTWGHSRRSPDRLRYLTPFLRPCIGLAGEPRQNGW